MKRVKSLVFNSLNFRPTDKKIGSEDIANVITSRKYTEETGFGFSHVEVSENILTAKILKRTPTYIQDYNIESQEIVRKQIFLFSDIQFSIDFNYYILYVVGGVSQLNYIKSILKNILEVEYESQPIDINASKFYQILVEKHIPSSIEQITINKFNYNNGFVGRFAGQVTLQSVGAELVSEYRNDIIKISFKIEVEGEEDLLIQVFQNGSIKLLVEESDFEFFISFIKTIIFS